MSQSTSRICHEATRKQLIEPVDDVIKILEAVKGAVPRALGDTSDAEVGGFVRKFDETINFLRTLRNAFQAMGKVGDEAKG